MYMTTHNLAPLEQTPFDLNATIDWLKSKDYRIICPFAPRTSYCVEPPPGKLLKAAILDTETTGVNLNSDKIVELGIVIFEYCPETGQVYRVLETYNALEDPGMAIPAEATRIHGITDDMVRGNQINDSEVERLMADVSLVIAHNAAFDRGFAEARLPFFQQKAWMCSYTQMPWKNEGFGAASLEFLSYKCGFHFNGHRASTDCHALLEILQSELPISKVKALKMLLDSTNTSNIKLWAINSPFETKDKLKAHGYNWNPERKTWFKTILNDALVLETNWLKSEIYANRSFKLGQETIDAYDQFSSRSGAVKMVNY